MAPSQPFTIASVAPILDEFKKLSIEYQGIASMACFSRGKCG